MKAPWLYDRKPFQVTDNVWYVGNDQVAVHLIDTGDGLILIDTAWPSTLYLLIESIREAGFNPYDVKYIVHSHGHVDHWGGTRRFVEKYGAETFMGEKDRPLMTDRIDLSCSIKYSSEGYADFKIDHWLHDGDTITLGNTTITVYEAPGHTPGTLGIFFDSTVNGRTVRCGMHGGVGINTLAKDYMETYGINWRGVYKESMEKMMAQHVDVVLGNHPYQAHVFERLNAAKDGENPFVDPTWWPTFLKERMDMYNELMEKEPVE